jgi:diguanylate cyclase (GGDEF)-like protein/PAS domain S-box-containing protein
VRSADARLLLAALVFTLGLSAWELSVPLDDPLANVVSNALMLVPGLAVAWVAARTARDPRLTSELHGAWRWLAAALGLYLLGDVAFFSLKLAHSGALLGASPADVLYLASYPVALAGVLRLRGWTLRSGERAAFWLDAAIMAIALGLVAWISLVRPTLADPGRTVEGLLAVAYVVGDAVLLLVLAIAVLDPERGRAARRVVGCLALGLLVRLAADTLYWYDILVGERGLPGTVAAVLFHYSWLPLGLAALVQREDPAPPAPVPGAAEAVSTLPSLLAASGYAVLGLGLLGQLTLDLAVLVLAGMGLTVAVLVRQLVAVRAAARLAAERAARANEARFRSLVENASDIVLVVGEDLRLRFHTPSAERFFGRAGAELDGASLLDLVHPDDRPAAGALVADALREAGTTASAEWRASRPGDDWRFVEVRASAPAADPTLGGAILTLRSVHERKVLEARLAHQAFHDPLTHLANRVLFADRLEHALLRARRGGRAVTVVFVDLDNFKTVNDSYGHAAGDQLLVELSRRLVACVRAGDTAARLGGDEFAVLLEEGAGVDAAREIAERVSEAVRAPFLLAGRQIVLGASLGIASSEGSSDTAGDLLRNADVAMYRAKASGKGRVVVFEASMQTAVRERLELEADLRGALGRGEFSLLYQPIVLLASGRIVGAEALVRWDHPRRGRLRPAEFFAAAEAAGAALDVGAWVVEEACRAARRWPIADMPGRLPLVCVNVSPRLFATRDFVARVEAAVAGSSLPPGRLVLEMTEGAAVEDAASTFATMRRLKALGVRLAIDDFGAGYSSLSHLQDLPVDVLKLDKLFVDGLSGEGRSRLVTRGILDLARALGKLVVAEGIEEPVQAERLRELGCTLGQGYLFSRPVGEEEIEARLGAAAGLVPGP